MYRVKYQSKKMEQAVDEIAKVILDEEVYHNQSTLIDGIDSDGAPVTGLDKVKYHISKEIIMMSSLDTLDEDELRDWHSGLTDKVPESECEVWYVDAYVVAALMEKNKLAIAGILDVIGAKH